MSIDETPTTNPPTSPDDDMAAIVNAHWPSVFKMLFWMTGQAHDAEELTQETFLRAMSRFEAFRPGSNVRAWLLRIGANAFLDLQRKRKRSKQVPLEVEVASDPVEMDDRLDAIELGKLVQAALEELSALTRTVFHLRVQESLPFREIGEMLGIKEQAARWHMHQARRKLAVRLNRNRDD